MNLEKMHIQIAVSIVAIVFSLVHVIKPELGIDYIFLAFVIIAALPWLLPLLKSVELPGGVKIELKEIRSATEKITTTLNIHSARHGLTSSRVEVTESKNDNFTLLRNIAASDPNLAFVGFRIEVEKRMRLLAEQNAISSEKLTLGHLLRELKYKELLAPEQINGLLELISLGNKAAHGASVDPEAANWLLETGPDIIAKLDSMVEDTKTA